MHTNELWRNRETVDASNLCNETDPRTPIEMLVSLWIIMEDSKAVCLNHNQPPLFFLVFSRAKTENSYIQDLFIIQRLFLEMHLHDKQVFPETFTK